MANRTSRHGTSKGRASKPPPSRRAARSRAARSGERGEATGERVQHVIVLMMENRSFDHMLGHVFNPNALPVPRPADYVLPVDPDHSHRGAMWQLLGKKPNGMPIPIGTITMGGFEAAFADKIHGTPGVSRRDVLRCFKKNQIPVLTMLAQEYAVCEQWFCSVPGETWPNRNFAHAATSDGEVNNNNRFFLNRTIFEELAAAERTWRIYHRGPAQAWAFPRLWDAPWRNRFGDHDELFEDIQGDDLPDYAFIEPDHGLYLRDWLGRSNSQHPGNNTESSRDFVAGEALIQKVYMALRAQPKVWKKTLLVITYDEHGGFYDHVPPPLNQSPAVAPDKKGLSSFGFNLLGPRVPTVLVSPWIKRGTRDGTVYEHSSIPRTLRELFAPHAPPLSKRDVVAKSFLHNVTLTKARTDAPTTDPARPLASLRAASTPRVSPDKVPPRPLDDFQESMLELTQRVDQALQAQQQKRRLTAAYFARAPRAVPRSFDTEAERARYIEDVMMRFRATAR